MLKCPKVDYIYYKSITEHSTIMENLQLESNLTGQKDKHNIDIFYEGFF